MPTTSKGSSDTVTGIEDDMQKMHWMWISKGKFSWPNLSDVGEDRRRKAKRWKKSDVGWVGGKEGKGPGKSEGFGEEKGGGGRMSGREKFV